jgi:hypothetical protein
MRVLEILLVTLGGVWQGLRQDFNLLEIALIALGWWAWKTRRLWRVTRSSPKILRWPSWPAAKPWTTAILIAAGAIALRLALLPLLHSPVPVVSDEFSHLLLADTLLDGRVANPTHPYWQHFETLQVIQHPHYGSDYFPGQAAVLAAGRAVIGSAWAGVLSECFAFLLILYWALRGWMPARWALAGVALAALRFGIGSYWVNAYHGGFLPAAGGALIMGAFPRILRQMWGGRPRPQTGPPAGLATPLMARPGARLTWISGPAPLVGLGLSMGLGLAILITTRPFEGLLYSLPFLAMLAWNLRRNIRSLLATAIPAATMAAAALVAIGMYFSHVTGSPFVTAYQVNQKAYGWPMGLAWTPPPKIEFRNVELKNYYDYELGEREKVDGPIDFVEYLTFRLQEYWRFFLGPALTVPLIMIAAVWRRKPALIWGLAGGVFAILLEGAASPHYLAPATAVIVAIVIECCRHFHAKRISIIPMLLATMALVLALRIAAQNLGLPYTQNLNYQSWCCKVDGNMNKLRITRTLERIPGEHLVFVKTKTDPFNLLPWIYNAADIDASRIVWARDLGPERDAQLAAYFHGRQMWVVDPNVEPAALVKY